MNLPSIYTLSLFLNYPMFLTSFLKTIPFKKLATVAKFVP